jgi:hypothetical protein
MLNVECSGVGPSTFCIVHSGWRFSAACSGDEPQGSDDQQREGDRRWQASMV